MPRSPWRRRRTADSPRPAGRRWAGRLRRSRSLARQVLLVGRRARRRTESGATIVVAEYRPDGDIAGIDPIELERITGMRTDPLTVTPVGPALVAADVPSSGPLSIPLLPGERTAARRMRFALVNGCTVGSLLLGVGAIFLAVNHANVHFSALCLIACVIFDGLDGALARKLGVASPFGAQMDSLVDMCSFGIAAPVVVYAWLAGTVPAGAVVPACALVAVCAAIRLARFNVSPKDGRFFCGVPTTLAAAVLALGTLMAPQMPAVVTIAAVVVLALAMVSGFPYAKLPRLFRLPPWLLLLPVVGALLDYRLTFAGIVVAYLFSGPILWLRQRSA